MKTKVSKPPVSVCAFIQPPRDSFFGNPPSFEISIQPVLRGGTRSDWRWREDQPSEDIACTYSWEWDTDKPFRDFDGLQLHCYSSSLTPCYCYRDRFSVELKDAQRMAKTLAWVERRRDKILESQAEPASIGQEAVLFAQVLGADVIGYRSEDMTPNRDYGMPAYRWIKSRSEAGHTIDHLIARAGERYAAPVGFEAYRAAQSA